MTSFIVCGVKVGKKKLKEAGFDGKSKINGFEIVKIILKDKVDEVIIGESIECSGNSEIKRVEFDPKIKWELRKTLEPLKLWDADNFGIWTWLA